MIDFAVSLFGAPGDGIAPAVLLSIGGKKGPQYLFNVPDGFSRLVLEHRVRPGSHIMAVFATQVQPLSMGGLSGLIMRLRSDGHDKLHIIGPSGVQALSHSIRHFLRWRHPRLMVTECSDFQPALLYKDVYCEVAALWGGPLSWAAPDWLPTEGAQQAGQANGHTPANGNASADAQTSPSNDSSNDVLDVPDSDGTSSSSSEDEAPARHTANQPEAVFDQLDAIFAGNRSEYMNRHSVVNLLQRQRGTRQQSGPAGLSPQQQAQHRQHAQQQIRPGQQARMQLNGTPPPKAEAQAVPPPGASGSAGIAGQPDTEAEFVALEPQQNPVYGRKQRTSTGPGSMANRPLWGYLCYVKPTNKLLLLVDVPSMAALHQLQAHPALHHLGFQGDRLAATVHLTGPKVASSPAYRQWIKSLPGQQVVMCGSPKPPKELGLISSARNLAKLSLISPRVFPLPRGARPSKHTKEATLAAAAEAHALAKATAEREADEKAATDREANEKAMADEAAASGGAANRAAALDSNASDKVAAIKTAAEQGLPQVGMGFPGANAAGDDVKPRGKVVAGRMLMKLHVSSTSTSISEAECCDQLDAGVVHDWLLAPRLDLPALISQIQLTEFEKLPDVPLKQPRSPPHRHQHNILSLSNQGDLRSGHPQRQVPDGQARASMQLQQAYAPGKQQPPPIGPTAYGQQQRQQQQTYAPLSGYGSMPWQPPPQQQLGQDQPGPALRWHQGPPPAGQPGAGFGRSPPLPAPMQASNMQLYHQDSQQQHWPQHAQPHPQHAMHAGPASAWRSTPAAQLAPMQMHLQHLAAPLQQLHAHSSAASPVQLPPWQQHGMGSMALPPPQQQQAAAHLQLSGYPGGMLQAGTVAGCASVSSGVGRPDPANVVMVDGVPHAVAAVDANGQIVCYLPGSAAVPAQGTPLGAGMHHSHPQPPSPMIGHRMTHSGPPPGLNMQQGAPGPSAAPWHPQQAQQAQQGLHIPAPPHAGSMATAGAPPNMAAGTDQSPWNSAPAPNMYHTSASHFHGFAGPPHRASPGFMGNAPSHPTSAQPQMPQQPPAQQAQQLHGSPTKRKAPPLSGYGHPPQGPPPAKRPAIAEQAAAFLAGNAKNPEEIELSLGEGEDEEGDDGEGDGGGDAEGVAGSGAERRAAADAATAASTTANGPAGRGATDTPQRPPCAGPKPAHTADAVDRNGRDAGKVAAASERGATTEAAGEPVPAYLQEAIARGDTTQVVFLGTGSAEPSKYRGASAIHVRFDHGWGILMDAGEGAYGQLIRRYGYKGAAQQVAALACVWVSHKHADHMAGLAAIIAARSPNSPPLLVIGPKAVQDWLGEIGPAQRLRYRFVHSRSFNQPQHPEHAPLLHLLGLASWQSVAVDHCFEAFALVLHHQDGWKLVYSGDTRPCPRLRHAGRGATLLIHEATFEPALQAQALSKRHSTTDEALQVASDMGAYRTILTHFSQRYPKIPTGLPTSGPDSLTTAIAFDGMSVPLVLLPDLPKLMPAVACALDPPPDPAAAVDNEEKQAVLEKQAADNEEKQTVLEKQAALTGGDGLGAGNSADVEAALSDGKLSQEAEALQDEGCGCE